MTTTQPTTAPADQAPVTVSIPLPGIDVQRPTQHGDGYRLEIGRFIARGTTLAAAKADLARQIALAIETVTTDLAFARDDDGTLLVAVDRPWGIDTHRVTEQGHRLISCSNRDGRTPEEDLAACDHYTLVPARR
ncbi:hypothetical protein ACFYWP_39835 [Actinacidiphila glaucinigra]|uniref:hypothetical protein n=1 Tax=Actinacidiphila glaucinigra TaxID=235986 RepID=UPI003689AB55